MARFCEAAWRPTAINLNQPHSRGSLWELHDNGTDNDSPATSKLVSDEGEDPKSVRLLEGVRHGNNGAYRIDGVEETEGCAIGIPEVVFPVVD